MYLPHFGLRERPFSNTPDPRFIYMGARHEEALAHLLYGVQEHGGFVQLTGDIGTGKTTVCRLLLERVPEGVDVALILNPVLTPEELLATLCDELDVKYESQSRKALVDALYRHLLAAHSAGRRTVLIVDEAQNLTVAALEQLRLLTNLETATQKLLQIILIGQPELTDLLGRRELRQLSQRITARYHLQPFTEPETRAYVRHRLVLAGGAADIFDRGALRAVHRLSGGVPRLINVICDRALLGAYAQRRARVDRRTIRAAAREVFGARTRGRRPRAPWQLVLAAAAVLVLAGIAAAVLSGVAPAVLNRVAPGLRARRATTERPADRPSERKADSAATPSPADAAPAPLAEPSQPPRPEAVQAVQPPPLEAVQAVQPTLIDLLKPGGLTADRRSAFTTIFTRWQLEPRGWSDPCAVARSMGLECLTVSGGWTRLRRLDLPAVLKLVTPDGGQHWGTVVALEGKQAQLALGGRETTGALDEIYALWDGRFEVLWQPPPVGRAELTPGSRGKPVAWLRHRLDALDGATIDAGGDVYDERLTARVLAFQRSQSLAVDGIAGVETLARLGSLADQRIPSLSRGGK